MLVYNIRYATGTGPAFHLPVPGAGYLRSNRKVPERHHRVHPASERADVVDWSKWDSGSIRTGMLNQANKSPDSSAIIRPSSAVRCRSINQLNAHRAQAGHASCRAERACERFPLLRYRDQRADHRAGTVGVCVFLVHLSLKFRQRQYQLALAARSGRAGGEAGDRGG